MVLVHCDINFIPPEGFLQYYQFIDDKFVTGGFGIVRVAVHKITGIKVAVKILCKLKLEDDLPRAYEEIFALQSLHHQNIVKLYEVYEDEERILMVMEYLEGGELFDYILAHGYLDENEGRIIFRQIAAAVAYMHSKSFAHRDLKSENIMLDSMNTVKLVDFGLCANPKGGINQLLKTNCGSIAYASPETYIGCYRGGEAEIWTLGVLLFSMLTGGFPFPPQTAETLADMKNSFSLKLPPQFSDSLKDLLQNMMCIKPNERLSIWQVLDHDWVCMYFGGPPDWISRKNNLYIDHEIAYGLSNFYGITVTDICKLLKTKDMNNLSAHYNLAVKRKELVVANSFVSALAGDVSHIYALVQDRSVPKMHEPRESCKDSISNTVTLDSKCINAPNANSTKIQTIPEEEDKSTVVPKDTETVPNNDPESKEVLENIIEEKPPKKNMSLFGRFKQVFSPNKSRANIVDKNATVTEVSKHKMNNTILAKADSVTWTSFASISDLQTRLTYELTKLSNAKLIASLHIKEGIYRIKYKISQKTVINFSFEIVLNKNNGVGIRRKLDSGDIFNFFNICQNIFEKCGILDR